jgi:dCMP deaminase
MSVRKRPSADEVYLMMAVQLSRRSTCLDKQVGCIAVDRRNIIVGSGYNGAPRGFQHCIDQGYCMKEMYSNPAYCPSAHAEQNMLLTCKNPKEIFSIYLTLSPCINCIRILLNTGADRIIFLNEHKHSEPQKFWEANGKEWIKWTLKK